jgi:hypothetical protein
VRSRAWLRSDPHHFARIVAGLQGSYAANPLPAARAPARGTVVTITGRLRADRIGWGELMLDDRALDDALVAALALDPRSPDCRVEIVVRVLDDPASG